MAEGLEPEFCLASYNAPVLGNPRVVLRRHMGLTSRRPHPPLLRRNEAELRMGQVLYTLDAIARRWHMKPAKARKVIDALPIMANERDWDYRLADGSLLWSPIEV